MPSGKSGGSAPAHGGATLAGAMLTGIGSRSAATSKVHRLYRDGHASEADFKSAVDRDESQLLGAQQGFAFKSGGQLAWLDLIRPIAKSFEGFAKRAESGEESVGPVTRWFRTNTFYRKPLVNAKIYCNGGELADIMPAGENSVIFLLGPYSFARLVENSHYDGVESLALDYSRALAKSARRLVEKGYRCMLLSEPFVGYEVSRGSTVPDWIAEALSEAKAAGVTMGVNFPLAEAGDAVACTKNSNVDFVGLDLTFSSSFKVQTNKDVLLGVVDGARVGVEGADEIKERVSRFLASAKFSGRYYIGPNDRLYDVPFEVALGKVDALAGIRF